MEAQQQAAEERWRAEREAERAQREAELRQWRAEREEMRAQLDQALSIVNLMGSQIGVSPPPFPPGPIVRRAETPPTVSGF